jgi:hypothetical protein
VHNHVNIFGLPELLDEAPLLNCSAPCAPRHIVKPIRILVEPSSIPSRLVLCCECYLLQARLPKPGYSAELAGDARNHLPSCSNLVSLCVAGVTYCWHHIIVGQSFIALPIIDRCCWRLSGGMPTMWLWNLTASKSAEGCLGIIYGRVRTFASR